MEDQLTGNEDTLSARVTHKRAPGKPCWEWLQRHKSECETTTMACTVAQDGREPKQSCR